MIVLDASVLIAHLNGNDAHHQRASSLLSERTGENLGASPISMAEALVAAARAGRLREGRAALESVGVHELSFGADAFVPLAELRARTGLKLPDCFVLLAAKEIGGAVASFDSALTAAARDLKLQTVE